MARAWDNKAPTVQLMGRWQPWHGGHLALFERAWSKTNQVCIMVRDTHGTDDKNPFDYEQVERRIVDELGAHGYQQDVDFVVRSVPNIVNITYGRDVGYAIEQEVFDDEIHQISATKLREKMKSHGLL